MKGLYEESYKTENVMRCVSLHFLRQGVARRENGWYVLQHRIAVQGFMSREKTSLLKVFIDLREFNGQRDG